MISLIPVKGMIEAVWLAMRSPLHLPSPPWPPLITLLLSTPLPPLAVSHLEDIGDIVRIE